MKKIFTILLLSGSLLMSGCSDWLDILPKAIYRYVLGVF